MAAWLLPTASSIPKGGKVRCVGEFDVTAYNRAYYHAKRKGKPRPLNPAQKKRRRIRAMERYYDNIEHHRAIARAAYWRRIAKQSGGTR